MVFVSHSDETNRVGMRKIKYNFIYFIKNIPSRFVRYLAIK